MGCALVLALCAPGAAQEAGKALQEAQKLLERGDAREAAARLEKLLEKSPSLGEAHRLLGHAYRELGATEKARASYVDALAFGRWSPDAIHGLLVIDRKGGRPLATRSALRTLALFEPGNVDWPLLAAEIAARLGDHGEAYALFRRVHERVPARRTPLVGMGNAALRRDRPREAERAFAAAYFLGEADAGLARRLAGLAERRGSPRDAVAWLERAVAAGAEERAELELRRARLLLEIGKTDAARDLARQLTDAGDPIAGRAHRLLAQIATEKGEKAAVIEHLRAARERGETSAQALAYLAADHFRNERYAAAAKRYRERLAMGAEAKGVRRRLIVSLLRAETDDAEIREAIEGYVARHGLDDAIKPLVKQWSVGARAVDEGE